MIITLFSVLGIATAAVPDSSFAVTFRPNTQWSSCSLALAPDSEGWDVRATLPWPARLRRGGFRPSPGRAFVLSPAARRKLDQSETGDVLRDFAAKYATRLPHYRGALRELRRRWSPEDRALVGPALETLAGRAPGTVLRVQWLARRGVHAQAQRVELILPEATDRRGILVARAIGRAHRYLTEFRFEGDCAAITPVSVVTGPPLSASR